MLMCLLRLFLINIYYKGVRMELKVRRYGLGIENSGGYWSDLDLAYIEDTLCLKERRRM